MDDWLSKPDSLEWRQIHTLDSGLIKHWIKELDATVSTQDVEKFKDPLTMAKSVSPPGIHCVILESANSGTTKKDERKVW